MFGLTPQHIKKIVFFFVLYGMNFNSVQAIPYDSLNQNEESLILTGPYRESVIKALLQPLPHRITQLQSAGSPAFNELKQMIFDNKEKLLYRWRALTALGRINPQEALPIIETALRSSDWFLKNAALLSLTYSSREKIIFWSRQLLDDKSLMVRTAAVQMIEKVKGEELSDLLWNKLNAKENFKNGQSLWIRRHIVRTLSHFAHPDDQEKFINVLKDNDRSLHYWALVGLAQLSGEEKPKETIVPKLINQKRKYWLSLAKNHLSSIK